MHTVPPSAPSESMASCKIRVTLSPFFFRRLSSRGGGRGGLRNSHRPQRTGFKRESALWAPDSDPPKCDHAAMGRKPQPESRSGEYGDRFGQFFNCLILWVVGEILGEWDEVLLRGRCMRGRDDIRQDLPWNSASYRCIDSDQSRTFGQVFRYGSSGIYCFHTSGVRLKGR